MSLLFAPTRESKHLSDQALASVDLVETGPGKTGAGGRERNILVRDVCGVRFWTRHDPTVLHDPTQGAGRWVSFLSQKRLLGLRSINFSWEFSGNEPQISRCVAFWEAQKGLRRRRMP